MEKRRAVNDYYTQCFFALWTIFNFAFFLFQQSEISYMYDVFDLNIWIYDLIIIFTLLLCIFGRKYTKEELGIYAAVILLVILNVLKMRDRYVLASLLFFIAAGQIDIDQFVRFDIKLKLILLILIVGLCALGLIDNYSSIINGAYKQALGFSHPNTLASFSLLILLEYVYLRYNKLCKWDAILIVATIAVIWQFTMSRTSVYTFVVVLIFVVLEKRFSSFFQKPICEWLFSLLPMLCGALCLLLSWLYSKGVAFVIKLDTIMTYRISAAQRMFERYGFSVIGQKVATRGTRSTEIAENTIFNADMAYMAIPIRYGVIIAFLLLLGYFFLSRRVLRCEKKELIMVMVYFSLLGIAETALYRISYNFIIIFMLSYKEWKGKKYDLRQLLKIALKKGKNHETISDVV